MIYSISLLFSKLVEMQEHFSDYLTWCGGGGGKSLGRRALNDMIVCVFTSYLSKLTKDMSISYCGVRMIKITLR